jgi:alginate O-acetyltransferase complex protein AlgI
VLFNSPVYLLFLTGVVAANWLLVPRRFRPAFLLLCSWFFYAYWNPPFLLLILGLTVFNYGVGMLQGRLAVRRRSLMVAALVVDLGTLGVFKYLGYFEQSALRIAHLFSLPGDLPIVHLILPLGLSFFTFEFLHYQIEVYRGGPIVRNPVRFALFPAFFPTAILGPIKRYKDFISQVEKEPRFNETLFLEGIELVVRGLLKKAVADAVIGPVTDAVYANAFIASGGDAWLGMIAMVVQVYLDFSGYTDIARGSAQLLGYTVPLNFNGPLIAWRMSELWRRWHMSLSSWLRDYIYFPLGGSRVNSNLRHYFNLFVTIFLGGLWHGAANHYVAMGAVMGATLSAERAWQDLWHSRRWLPGLPFWVTVVGGWFYAQLSFLFIANLLRTPELGTYRALVHAMFLGTAHLRVLTGYDLLIVVALTVWVVGTQLVAEHWDLKSLINPAPVAIGLRPAYVLAVGLIAMYLAVTSANPLAQQNTGNGRADPNNPSQRFIYFQF